MNLNTLKGYRHVVYGCFGQAKDALFNIVDALISEDRAQSLPELSLSPHFERRCPACRRAWKTERLTRSSCKRCLPVVCPRAMCKNWCGSALM